MKKKIILFSLFFILIIISIIVVLINYDSNKTNTNERTITTSNNYNTEYYIVKIGKVDLHNLMQYLLWNNEYKNIPVTDNYIKNNSMSLSDKYGLTNYTGVCVSVDIEDSDTVIFDCGIFVGSYDDFITIKKQYYKCYLDENGLLDDMELIREEVYREDDGTPIIRPNNRKFDNKDTWYANYFEYLVLGLDYLKYDREELDYQDIEWEMREYALTDNLKRRYDLNKGLVPGELKEEAYNNNDRIGFCYKNNYFSFRKDFPKEKKATVPIELYLDYGNKQYTYNLSYSITDDYFLDDIFIEKQ